MSRTPERGTPTAVGVAAAAAVIDDTPSTDVATDGGLVAGGRAAGGRRFLHRLLLAAGAVALAALVVAVRGSGLTAQWRDWSLIDDAAAVVLGVLAAAGLAVVVSGGSGRRWWSRVLPACGLVAAGVVAVVAVVLAIAAPWPDPLPALVWVALAAAVFALAAAVAAVPGRRSWRRACTVAVAAGLVVVGAAGQVNVYFGQFPTPRALLGLPAPDQVEFTQLRLSPPAGVRTVASARAVATDWRPPADLPTAGVVSQVAIPGAVSRFAARPAWVYLPPAALTRTPPRLPVLVLLHGQPGAPRDWIDAGHLATMMDRFAAAHAGLAPIVVLPDPLGAALADPLCMDSRLANAHTYLAVDVPTWVRTHLPVDPDPQRWAVGGLSEGGTCAWQLAVNAPQVYPTFVDLSGQAEPTLGSHHRTVAATFAGDETAFDRVNPASILARRRLTTTTAFIVVGAGDGLYRPQAQQVAEVCRRAGLEVHYQEVPGSHEWRTWSAGLAAVLPDLAHRIRLI